MVFDWDSNKNSENIEKHGMSFEHAQEIFLDPLHLSVLDERFSYFEERWITMGAIEKKSEEAKRYREQNRKNCELCIDHILDSFDGVFHRFFVLRPDTESSGEDAGGSKTNKGRKPFE